MIKFSREQILFFLICTVCSFRRDWMIRLYLGFSETILKADFPDKQFYLFGELAKHTSFVLFIFT